MIMLEKNMIPLYEIKCPICGRVHPYLGELFLICGCGTTIANIEVGAEFTSGTIIPKGSEILQEMHNATYSYDNRVFRLGETQE